MPYSDTADVTVEPRFLVIIGSGEMAPQMARVHRSVIRALRAGAQRANVPAAVIDTPYGFQENADALSDQQLDFFGRRLGLDVTLASLRRADPGLVAREQAYATIREARFVFSGPGSPSYARRSGPRRRYRRSSPKSWSAAVPSSSRARPRRHSAASRCPSTRSTRAAPTRSGYLDSTCSSSLGVAAAVVPHWDNNEGSGHDTRYCFLGARRLQDLERQMPEDVAILGIDEHTALFIDINADTAAVHGRGNVTLRRSGVETVFASGATLAIDELRDTTYTRGPTAPASPSAATRDADLARELVELRGATDVLSRRSALVDPLVEELLRMRAEARAMGVYEVADRIRGRLTSLGIEVTDDPDGSSEFRLPD